MNIARRIRLLVVDDSAVMRQSMTSICKRAGGIDVTVASDPIIAKTKIARERPDVVLLDIEMPRMDGLTFLRQIMSEDPLPVVVCSALAGRGTEVALRALEEGAVDVVQKPRISLHEFLTDSNEMLIDTIRAAASARIRRQARAAAAPSIQRESASTQLRPTVRRTSAKVVAMGASTGGTEALREILEDLPPDAPGVVIVQHMPEVFTAAFARRLNETCRMEVKEAVDGDRVLDGRVLIAPGNRHLVVRRDGAHYRVAVTDGPLVSRHRPSVDMLFQSVAAAAGVNAIGVILTGMGNDGAAGLLEMRQAGAVTIAQDEASSVVFGMPGSAIAKGAAQSVHPLRSMAAVIVHAASKLREAG
jgi:two-component system, chemotaxis family, protein-glutamate methylesterase/glutaminase